MTVDRLALGDHVCWTFQDEDERLNGMARFVSAGLDIGHKVVYDTASLAPDAVLAELRARGVDVERPARSGQLQTRVAHRTFLHAGSFEPERIVDAYADLISRARQEGYAGVRIIGDMAWASDPNVTTDQLARFEAQANMLFAEGEAVGLCQYDRRRFPASDLRRVGAAHPGTTWLGSDSAWSPLLRMYRTSHPPGLRLDGEVDISNHDALASLLEAVITSERVAPRPAPVHIDVTGLTFADVRTAGLLIRTAGRAPAGLRLVGCQSVLARMLEVLGASHVSGLTVTADAATREAG